METQKAKYVKACGWNRFTGKKRRNIRDIGESDVETLQLEILFYDMLSLQRKSFIEDLILRNDQNENAKNKKRYPNGISRSIFLT